MKTVLIIEKNPEDAAMIAQHLRGVPSGAFDVVSRASMSEAENYLGQNLDKVDLILLNLRLPDVDGRWGAFERIRQYVFKIPVVVIVGSTTEDYSLAKALVEKGVEDILDKDSLQGNPDVLGKIIEFAICRHKLSGRMIKKSKKELEEKEMVISWLSGSYSVQQSGQ